MSSVKVLLVGAEQLSRAIKLADPKTKARMVAVIAKNTKAIAMRAKANAPKRTGEMASTIRDEYANEGLVGFVKVGIGKLPRRSKAVTAKGIARAKGRTRKVGKGAYSAVVERGDPRRHRKPEPFLMPAFQADKPTLEKDVKAALDNSVAEIAR